MAKNFFNTINLEGDGLSRAEARAAYQNTLIASIFRANPEKKISPSQMQQLIAKKYSRHLLIGSVRRSMTTLTDRGTLVKLGDADKILSPHGEKEHRWAYNAEGDTKALETFFADLQEGRLEERHQVGQQPPTPKQFVQQELFA